VKVLPLAYSGQCQWEKLLAGEAEILIDKNVDLCEKKQNFLVCLNALDQVEKRRVHMQKRAPDVGALYQKDLSPKNHLMI
jgi:hypothetical protein